MPRTSSCQAGGDRAATLVERGGPGGAGLAAFGARAAQVDRVVVLEPVAVIVAVGRAVFLRGVRVAVGTVRMAGGLVAGQRRGLAVGGADVLFERSQVADLFHF